MVEQSQCEINTPYIRVMFLTQTIGWETKLGQTFYKGVFDHVCQTNNTKGLVSTMTVIGAYFGHQRNPLHLSEAVIDFARIKMTFWSSIILCIICLINLWEPSLLNYKRALCLSVICSERMISYLSELWLCVLREIQCIVDVFCTRQSLAGTVSHIFESRLHYHCPYWWSNETTQGAITVNRSQKGR